MIIYTWHKIGLVYPSLCLKQISVGFYIIFFFLKKFAVMVFEEIYARNKHIWEMVGQRVLYIMIKHISLVS